MNYQDRRRIDCYYNILVKKTNFKQIYTLLLRWGVIPVHLEAFKDVASRSDEENNKILYKVIKGRGPTAFSRWKHALQLTNPELFGQFEGKKWNFPGEQWKCLPSVYNLSNGEIFGAFCLITFPNYRSGWEEEKRNLEVTFQSLHFEGTSYVGPSKTEFEDALTKFSNIQNAASYVFALCGHGRSMTEGEVVLQTNESYKSVKEILLKICTAPALLNKPKIIILQLCRGETIGIEGIKGVSTPRVYNTSDIPGIKDTIVLRPCLPGHVAYRDSISGGWLIKLLTDMIQRYARSKDVEEIMILVCDELAKMRSNQTGYYEHVHHSRYMIPCAYTYSFKKFYFVPEEERD